MSEPKIVRWEDPPERIRAAGRVDWTPVAEELRARSGHWAVVAEMKGKQDAEDRRLRALAGSIRTGNIRAFTPKGSYEAVTRMIGDEVRLYVRHVGPPAD